MVWLSNCLLEYGLISIAFLLDLYGLSIGIWCSDWMFMACPMKYGLTSLVLQLDFYRLFIGYTLVSISIPTGGLLVPTGTRF